MAPQKKKKEIENNTPQISVSLKPAAKKTVVSTRSVNAAAKDKEVLADQARSSDKERVTLL